MQSFYRLAPTSTFLGKFSKGVFSGGKRTDSWKGVFFVEFFKLNGVDGKKVQKRYGKELKSVERNSADEIKNVIQYRTPLCAHKHRFITRSGNFSGLPVFNFFEKKSLQHHCV